ncbi:MAG TPA: histone [Candidatus Nanoarchaeia archaeon]|nr:histone [Candidatus Nanoarchaeia archaeon]
MGDIRTTTTIPQAPTGRILTAAGAERVSADAMAAFSQVLHSLGLKLSQRAAEISKHAGRKTIQESDIRLAARQI